MLSTLNLRSRQFYRPGAGCWIDILNEPCPRVFILTQFCTGKWYIPVFVKDFSHRLFSTKFWILFLMGRFRNIVFRIIMLFLLLSVNVFNKNTQIKVFEDNTYIKLLRKIFNGLFLLGCSAQSKAEWRKVFKNQLKITPQTS